MDQQYDNNFSMPLSLTDINLSETCAVESVKQNNYKTTE